VGPGSYGLVMSYLDLQDKESKDSDLENGFDDFVSSKFNLNDKITIGDLDIRDSSNITNGAMFHTFDMENG